MAVDGSGGDIGGTRNPRTGKEIPGKYMTQHVIRKRRDEPSFGRK